MNQPKARLYPGSSCAAESPEKGVYPKWSHGTPSAWNVSMAALLIASMTPGGEFGARRLRSCIHPGREP